MKNNESPVGDAISIESIKMGETTLLKILSKRYNDCLSDSVIPSEWNKVTVKPLHNKKGSITRIQN